MQFPDFKAPPPVMGEDGQLITKPKSNSKSSAQPQQQPAGHGQGGGKGAGKFGSAGFSSLRLASPQSSREMMTLPSRATMSMASATRPQATTYMRVRPATRRMTSASTWMALSRSSRSQVPASRA